jgi:long-chain acyl-CoA synthetase
VATSDARPATIPVEQNGRGAVVTAAAIPDERAPPDPHGPCIADERHDLDNARFASAVTATAALFASAGLGNDDVLAIMLPNRVELVTSIFAAWQLGAAVTPVNPALTAQQARYQIDDAAVTLVVADDGSAVKLQDIGRPIIPANDVTSPARPKTLVPVSSAPDTRALLIYTSGTTGRPMGVVRDGS